MRSAIFSDIHGNLQALEAVIDDAKAHGCHEFYCLGDIVGYNANPSECIEIVRNLCRSCIQGNHDERASGVKSLHDFNTTATIALEWTRVQLNLDQKSWLATISLQQQVRQFILVHSSLYFPSTWRYVQSINDAEMSIALQSTPLCFIGHTHVPRFFIQRSGTMESMEIPSKAVTLSSGAKFLINGGSVGQPRDGDWRASYVIYDEESYQLYFRRVEYDLEKAMHAVIHAGLPEKLATRLRLGA